MVQPRRGPRSECWPDAPAAVPAFLRYLGRHGIGMTVWALRPGVMLTSGNLVRPTSLGSHWACRGGLDKGAGRPVMSWFRHRNHAPTAGRGQR